MMTTYRRCAYLIAPIPIYGTKAFKRARVAAREHSGRYVPDTSILFSDSRHWLRAWPQWREEIAVAYILRDPAGYIGKGGHTEMSDLCADGVRVYVLDEGCADMVRTHPEDWVADGPSWRQYAHYIGETNAT